MNLETKITIYKFTPQVFTLTPYTSMQEQEDIIDCFYLYYLCLLCAV